MAGEKIGNPELDEITQKTEEAKQETLKALAESEAKIDSLGETLPNLETDKTLHGKVEGKISLHDLLDAVNINSVDFEKASGEEKLEKLTDALLEQVNSGEDHGKIEKVIHFLEEAGVDLHPGTKEEPKDLAVDQIKGAAKNFLKKEGIVPSDVELEKGGVELKVEQKTIAHEEHPERNEDTILSDEKNGLFGVFDGMGGYAGGDVASGFAKDYFESHVGEFKGLSLEEAKNKLAEIVKSCNADLVKKAESDPNLARMGTTGSVVKMWDGGQGQKKAIVANVGDSRVYLLKKSGQLEQLTIDDDLLQDDVRKGNIDQQTALEIKEEIASAEKPLRGAARRYFQGRNLISQNLGQKKDLELNVRDFVVDEGDRVIITSDGIHDNLTQKEIEKIANQEGVSAGMLVEAALKRSHENSIRAKSDDMSAVVIRMAETAKEPTMDAEGAKKETEPANELSLTAILGALHGGEEYVAHIAHLAPERLGREIKNSISKREERVEELEEKILKGKRGFASLDLLEKAKETLVAEKEKLAALKGCLEQVKTMAGVSAEDSDKVNREKVEGELKNIIGEGAKKELESPEGIKRFLVSTLGIKERGKDFFGDVDQEKLHTLAQDINDEMDVLGKKKKPNASQARRLDFLQKVSKEIHEEVKGKKLGKKEVENLVEGKLQELFFAEEGGESLVKIFSPEEQAAPIPTPEAAPIAPETPKKPEVKKEKASPEVRAAERKLNDTKKALKDAQNFVKLYENMSEQEKGGNPDYDKKLERMRTRVQMLLEDAARAEGELEAVKGGAAKPVAAEPVKPEPKGPEAAMPQPEKGLPKTAGESAKTPEAAPKPEEKPPVETDEKREELLKEQYKILAEDMVPPEKEEEIIRGEFATPEQVKQAKLEGRHFDGVAGKWVKESKEEVSREESFEDWADRSQQEGDADFFLKKFAPAEYRKYNTLRDSKQNLESLLGEAQKRSESVVPKNQGESKKGTKVGGELTDKAMRAYAEQIYNRSADMEDFEREARWLREDYRGTPEEAKDRIAEIKSRMAKNPERYQGRRERMRRINRQLEELEKQANPPKWKSVINPLKWPGVKQVAKGIKQLSRRYPVSTMVGGAVLGTIIGGPVGALLGVLPGAMYGSRELYARAKNNEINIIGPKWFSRLTEREARVGAILESAKSQENGEKPKEGAAERTVPREEKVVPPKPGVREEVVKPDPEKEEEPGLQEQLQEVDSELARVKSEREALEEKLEEALPKSLLGKSWELFKTAFPFSTSVESLRYKISVKEHEELMLHQQREDLVGKIEAQKAADAKRETSLEEQYLQFKKEVLPIGDGPFDVRERLKKIVEEKKESKERGEFVAGEVKQKTEAVRDLHLRQQEALARCRVFIEQEIEKNPDIKEGKFDEWKAGVAKWFDEFGKEYGFTPQHRAELDRRLSLYKERQENAQKVLKKFEGDKAGLIEKITGKKISELGISAVDLGRVQVSLDKMSLVIKVDGDIINKLYDKDADFKSNVGGFHGLREISPGAKLDFIVLQSGAFRRHEIQHGINALFEDEFRKLSTQEELDAYLASVKNREPLKSQKEKAREYFEGAKGWALGRVKDEFFAMLLGSPTNEGFNKFKANWKQMFLKDEGADLYDYFKRARESAAYATYDKMAEKIFKEEYAREIEGAVAAFAKLLESGRGEGAALELLKYVYLENWQDKVKQRLSLDVVVAVDETNEKADWSEFEGKGWRGAAFHLKNLEKSKGGSLGHIAAVKGLVKVKKAREALIAKLETDTRISDMGWAKQLARELKEELSSSEAKSNAEKKKREDKKLKKRFYKIINTYIAKCDAYIDEFKKKNNEEAVRVFEGKKQLAQKRLDIPYGALTENVGEPGFLEREKQRFQNDLKVMKGMSWWNK